MNIVDIDSVEHYRKAGPTSIAGVYYGRTVEERMVAVATVYPSDLTRLRLCGDLQGLRFALS